MLLRRLVAVLSGLCRLREHAQHLHRTDPGEDRSSLGGAPTPHELNRKITKASRYLINCFRHAGETRRERGPAHAGGRQLTQRDGTNVQREATSPSPKRPTGVWMIRRPGPLTSAACVLAIAGLIAGCSAGGNGGGLGVASGHASSSSAASPAPAPTPPAGVALSALQRMHWTALPADPLGRRQLTVTAWTGRALLVVGGAPVSGNGPGFTAADAYDPRTRTWRLLPDFPLAARVSSASAWTGYGLLVWGGVTAPGGKNPSIHALGDGAILDVAERHWIVLPAGPLPALNGPVAVTDARDRVIVLGGTTDHPSTVAGGPQRASRLVASYDPATRLWHRLPSLPAVRDHDVAEVDAVRWGTRVLVAETWVHIVPTGPGAIEGSGGVDLFLLDPDAGTWSPFTVGTDQLVGADLRPLGQSASSPLAIGGGSACPLWAACPATPNSAFTVVDARGRELAGGAVPPIEVRAETNVGTSYVAMTGAQITGPGRDEQPGDAAAFDLGSKRWVVLPSARRFRPQPEWLAWTGHELVAVTPTGLIALGPH